MKEFVEKLIERLEQLKADAINEACPIVPNSEDCEMEYSCASCHLSNAIKIVNKLAEEYNSSKSSGLSEPYKPEEKSKFSNEELDAIMDKILDNQVWILCNERLPQEEEPEGTLCRVVNVVLKNGFVTSGWCNRYLKKWYVLDYCSDYPMPHEYEDIIAWQPLPEPYSASTSQNLVTEQKEIPVNHYIERFNKVQ